MRRLIAALIVVEGIGGCARTPPPEPMVRTLEVHIPVPVPCKATVAVHQAYTDDTADQQPSIFDKVKALLIGREERKEDAAKLKGAVIGCGGTVQ